MRSISRVTLTNIINAALDDVPELGPLTRLRLRDVARYADRIAVGAFVIDTAQSRCGCPWAQAGLSSDDPTYLQFAGEFDFRTTDALRLSSDWDGIVKVTDAAA